MADFELIEKVAIAICPWDNGKRHKGDPSLYWDGMKDDFKQAYREQAKAAIAAMGEVIREKPQYGDALAGFAQADTQIPEKPEAAHGDGCLVQQGNALPSSTSSTVSTKELVALLTQEFKNLAPSDDDAPWQPVDYAIEAVRFLGQYQYEPPNRLPDTPKVEAE